MMEDNTSPKGKKHKLCKSKGKFLIILPILLVCLIILILALTVFKIEDPKIEVLSVEVHGFKPHFSFPFMQIQLNVTFDLKIQVDNPNHADFEHGGEHGVGKSLLIYGGNQIGEVELEPGVVPAKGSAIIPATMVIILGNNVSSNTEHLFDDIQAGKIEIEIRSRIPGRASLLGGFIKKDIVATSQCQLTIGFPDVTTISKECKKHTEL